MKIPQLRQLGLFLVKLALMAAITWYLCHTGFLTPQSFRLFWTSQHLPILLFSGGAFVIAGLLSTWRLLLLLKAVDMNLRFIEGFQLTFMGFFFNLVLPGVIGGDVIKGYYLFRQEHHEKGTSTGVVIFDRLLGLLAMISIGCVAIGYLLQQHTSHLLAHHQQLYVLFGITGLLPGMVLLLILSSRNPSLRKRFQAIIPIRLRNRAMYHLMHSIGKLSLQMSVVVSAFGISIVIQGVSLIGLVSLCSLDAPVSLAESMSLMAVSALILLAGIIPVTPGNIGWTEFLAAYGWSAIGSHAGAEIFLYWRIISILCSLPGGVFYLFWQHKKGPLFSNQIEAVKL